VQNFRKLRVWQRAHELTLSVYRLTLSFPPEERFGLTSQIRRAASSVGANIAEGCGRTGDPEFARFCSIAMGSASELEYHLLLAQDLKLIALSDYEELGPRATEVKQMLAALLRKLRDKS
jgi:four helix bundle protein